MSAIFFLFFKCLVVVVVVVVDDDTRYSWSWIKTLNYTCYTQLVRMVKILRCRRPARLWLNVAIIFSDEPICLYSSTIQNGNIFNPRCLFISVIACLLATYCFFFVSKIQYDNNTDFNLLIYIWFSVCCYWR